MLAQQPERATKPNVAWPQEPGGFKGIKFGATEEQAKSVVGPIFCMDGRRVGRMCVLNIHVADFDMRVILRFIGGRFTQALGEFPAQQYSDVRDMFVEKYGSAHHTEHGTVQNKMGATYDQESLFWRGDNAHVILERYGSTISEGSFAVSLADAPDPMRQEREQAKKKALE